MIENRDFKKNFEIKHELRRTIKYRKFIKKAREMQRQIHCIENNIGHRYLYTKNDKRDIKKALIYLRETILKNEFPLWEEYIKIYIFHEIQFPTRYIPEDQKITFLIERAGVK